MKVLVVDDEMVVRDLVCAILAREGHEAVSAKDGIAALDLAGQHAYDVVVTDFIMPGMNGCELVKLLRERHCPARYLLMSGTDSGTEGVSLPFLAKPFTAAQLVVAIENLSTHNTPPQVGPEDELQQARAAWREAMSEQQDAIAEVSTDIPLPDGSLLIQRLGAKRAAAYKRYLNALLRSRPPGSDPT
ncbi:MAG: response regulator [Acidobacteriia bacterium]|nr:response regulator [Terriglobia bacterium]